MTSIAFALVLPVTLGSDKDSKAIELVLNQYSEAVRTYDIKLLDKLFDPAYVEVSPVGEVDLRDKVLSFYKEKGSAPESMKVDEMMIRTPTKGFAVAIFRQTANMKIQDKVVSLSFRVTVSLRQTKSKWRMFSSQFVGIRTK